MVTAANPAMVTLLREAKGWNQMQLAAASGMSQGYLSRVERSFVSLQGDKLESVARALNCPAELLVSAGIVRSPDLLDVYHRRRSSKISVVAARKIDAISQLTQVTVDGLLEGISQQRVLSRSSFNRRRDNPIRAARVLRTTWEIPPGPLENVHRLLDAKGVIVVQRVFDQADQDAFSAWTRGDAPLIVLRRGLPVDRQRFTVCHELGHLLLHDGAGPGQEEEADQFAAELLTPADDIAPQLRGLTTGDFEKLIDLKKQWRVPIGALIQRARTLELITERQFREFRMKLSRFGWNAVEPIDLDPEYPRLLNDVIEIHRARWKRTDDELAQIAGMTPDAFQRHYLHHALRSCGTTSENRQTG